jgi:PAS domain S-box-containing protein
LASAGIENSEEAQLSRDRGDFEHALIGAIQDGLIIRQTDGAISKVNDAFCRMTGFDRAELLGQRPPHPFWPQDQYPDQNDAMARALAGEKWEREFVLATKDGRRIDVIVSAAPLPDGRGGFLGSVSTIKDVSHIKRRVREVERAAAEMAEVVEALARSNRELDQFAYVTSHDLKAPLRGIANLSRWIEEDMGERITPDVSKMLELMRGRVERMEKLIAGLLAYSRIGRERAAVEAVDSGAVVREAVELLSPPEGFVVEMAPGMPMVRAVRVRLVQVFMNLIGNAIKHRDSQTAPGRVRVSWGDAGEGLYEFRVADDGPGIDPRYHDRVFAIFQTLEPRDRVEGSGIGLALVKKIVEGAGGTIRIESEGGKGCVFVFTWPKRMTE